MAEKPIDQPNIEYKSSINLVNNPADLSGIDSVSVPSLPEDPSYAKFVSEYLRGVKVYAEEVLDITTMSSITEKISKDYESFD